MAIFFGSGFFRRTAVGTRSMHFEELGPLPSHSDGNDDDHDDDDDDDNHTDDHSDHNDHSNYSGNHDFFDGGTLPQPALHTWAGPGSRRF